MAQGIDQVLEVLPMGCINDLVALKEHHCTRDVVCILADRCVNPFQTPGAAEDASVGSHPSLAWYLEF